MANDALLKLARRYCIRTDGVIHVGAHAGEEAHAYNRIGATRQLWVEPHPVAFQRLTREVPASDRVLHANVACGPRRDTMTLHSIPTSNNGDSFLRSSLLEPDNTLPVHEHDAVAATIDVPVVPLDDLLHQHDLQPPDYPLLVLDTQGYELNVLKGAARYLRGGARFIYTEVSRIPLYKDQCLEPELDAHLAPLGFQRLYTRLSRHEHGNALYARRDAIHPLRKIRISIAGPKVRRSKKRSKRP